MVTLGSPLPPSRESWAEKGRLIMTIVVAGVDDSPVSKLVVDRACQEAKWRDGELHLVHVTYLSYVGTEVAINWDEVADAQRRSVWQQLEGAIADADVAIQTVDLNGYPPDMLAAYAVDQGASLLVLGTRGRGEFASLILGSTSHRAIHLASCDVLVVKAPSDSAGNSPDNQDS